MSPRGDAAGCMYMVIHCFFGVMGMSDLEETDGEWDIADNKYSVAYVVKGMHRGPWGVCFGGISFSSVGRRCPACHIVICFRSSGTLQALKEEAEEHDTALKELKKAKDRATKVIIFFLPLFFGIYIFFFVLTALVGIRLLRSLAVKATTCSVF